MKIYLNKANENWIVDRMREEFYNTFPSIVTEDPNEANLIWLIAPWVWKNVNREILQRKKVITTIHHIVSEKFDFADFWERDQITDEYHVPNRFTYENLQQLTGKQINQIPYWYDVDKWYPCDKNESRDLLKINQDDFVVGSFQRDTEGSDLITPKLCKGPDRFCDFVERIKKDNLLILLGGWRRQYVIDRLQKAKIRYIYIEKANIDTLRRMYASLDLYIISSRVEGGPQALMECAAMKVPIISTNCGMADRVLHSDCIVDPYKVPEIPSKEIVEMNYQNVKSFEINCIGECYNEVLKCK